MIINIANKLDRVVMYIQNNMIEHTINNPDFRKFLKRYHKPIIVLDDCEMLFSDYFNKSNITVNNLLQMVDGLNSLDLNIITIFNTDDEEDIDSNLLDSNNLLDIIEFDYLDKDEANELSSYLGEKLKHKNKIKLIDIIRKRSDRELKKIGF
jgi:Cdc6-like AAA superfamily ATPase